MFVALTDYTGWSLYGAERSQPVATGGKWDGRENGSDLRKPLLWVATSCRQHRMVRRRSAVRVRQRASILKKYLQIANSVVLASIAEHLLSRRDERSGR